VEPGVKLGGEQDVGELGVAVSTDSREARGVIQVVQVDRADQAIALLAVWITEARLSSSFGRSRLVSRNGARWLTCRVVSNPSTVRC
jgi:hypothetical protein